MVLHMDEVAMLSSVMSKTSELMEGVGAEQLAALTSCPDMNVKQLMEHMAGWVQAFDAAANGDVYEGDPAAYELTAVSPAEFRRNADSMVNGWRSAGFDRTVRLTGPPLPAGMVFNMTLMEYVTHGWDLATATGQLVPYSDDEAEETLVRARSTLPPEYRGPGKAFADTVPVPEGAAPLDRLIGFMGRSPG